MNYERDIREYWTSQMSEETRRTMSLAQCDLRYGPIYLDKDGEECSCFDDFKSVHDFEAACQALSQWCSDTLDTVYIEPWCGYISTFAPVDEEPIGYDDDGNLVCEKVPVTDVLVWDIAESKRILFGELAQYLP